MEVGEFMNFYVIELLGFVNSWQYSKIYELLGFVNF
jgi:hypothetical protein